MGGNCYAFYLVEWYWPDSDRDTEFGNYVLEKDIRVFATVDVKTTKSENQEVTTGVAIPYEQEPIWSVVNAVMGVILAGSIIATCVTVLRLENSYANFEHYPIKRYWSCGKK